MYGSLINGSHFALSKKAAGKVVTGISNIANFLCVRIELNERGEKAARLIGDCKKRNGMLSNL